MRECFFIFLQGEDKIETDEKQYVVATTPIKDKSLLSSHAQKLCENTDAYWMTPSCTDADANDSKFSQCRVSWTISFYFCTHF